LPPRVPVCSIRNDHWWCGEQRPIARVLRKPLVRNKRSIPPLRFCGAYWVWPRLERPFTRPSAANQLPQPGPDAGICGGNQNSKTGSAADDEAVKMKSASRDGAVPEGLARCGASSEPRSTGIVVHVLSLSSIGRDDGIRSQTWTLAAAVAASFVVLLPLLLDWPKPYVIVFVGTALWFVTIAPRCARRPAMQNVCVFLASVSFCLAIGEFGAWFLNASRPQMTDTLEFNYDDRDLGYSPEPSQRARARELYDNKVLFDVTYTIDTNGLRLIPTAAPLAECGVAFSGDSLTFGWGLADTETMPNQFVAASAGLYRGYNLAQNGYGPHHMLRMLETGRFDRVVGDDTINLVIYQGIVEHVARVVGRNTWDPRGPRYVT